MSHSTLSTITGRPARAACLAAVAIALATPSRATAQQTVVAPPPAAPRIGDAAPDFALPGATRYGLLRTPVRLSDFRGQTVVLAFFPKARTKG